jgi:DHA1 family tetracycline resistance protein-like MFS transporter
MTEQSAAPGPAKSRGAGLIFILIMMWIDVLSWSVSIPVYPRLFETFTNNDISKTAVLVVIFSTAFAAIQLFAAPVLGALSDRFGRRPVILISCFGLAVDLFVMALTTVAPNLALLAATRVIHAVTAASNAAAMAYIADVTAPEERAKAFGYVGASFGVGFIVGPGIGGMLGAIHLGLPFLLGGALALANFAYGLFVLPESLAKENRRPFVIREANPLGAIKFLASDRTLLALAAVSFVTALAQQVYPSVWVLYTQERYHWDTMAVGVTLAVSGVLSAIVQAGLIQPVVSRIGERRAVLVGLGCWVVSHFIAASARTWMVFVSAMPLGALSGLAGPALNALLSRQVAADRQGELQGATSSMQSLTGILGPSLFAGSFAYATAAGSPLPEPGAPFYISATLLLGAAVLAASATRRETGGAAA